MRRTSNHFRIVVGIGSLLSALACSKGEQVVRGDSAQPKATIGAPSSVNKDSAAASPAQSVEASPAVPEASAMGAPLVPDAGGLAVAKEWLGAVGRQDQESLARITANEFDFQGHRAWGCEGPGDRTAGPYHRSSKTPYEKIALVKCAVDDTFLQAATASPFADWDDAKPWQTPRVQVRPARVQSLSVRMNEYTALLAERSQRNWLYEFFATDGGGIHTEGVVVIDPKSKLVTGVFFAQWFVE